MRRICVLPSFERSFRRLSSAQRILVSERLEAFNECLSSGNFAPGFGFKKINHDKYEFRVDLHLRVVIKGEKDIFYLVLVGNHNDVRRFLRNFR